MCSKRSFRKCKVFPKCSVRCANPSPVHLRPSLVLPSCVVYLRFLSIDWPLKRIIDLVFFSNANRNVSDSFFFLL